MQNKCNILIKAGLVAAIASLSIGVPAQAGNVIYDSDSTTDSSVPSVSQIDGNTATTLAPSDADMAAFLGGPGSALDESFSQSIVITTTNSINTDLVDIRDLALLGGTTGGIDFDPIRMLGPVSESIIPYGNLGSSRVVATLESTPDFSQEMQDRPLVIKWIHSLLEAVGLNERCSDPNGCNRRIAVK